MWEKYSQDKKFIEDIQRIYELLGSNLYEVKYDGEWWFVRRVTD